jgi:hypothetical protein
VLRSLSRFRRPAALALALLGWAALGLQLRLSLATAVANGKTIPAGLVIFFSYFTILTNILAALCMTVLALAPQLSDRLVRAAAAVTVYISIVGIVYSLLLRNVWSPQGLQKIADVLLHDGLPLLIVLYWLFFLPHRRLRWTSPLAWLAYPLAYLVFTLALAPFTGFYPYPFIDVAHLGYARVLINALVLTIGFLAAAFTLVALDRFLSRTTSL